MSSSSTILNTAWKNIENEWVICKNNNYKTKLIKETAAKDTKKAKTNFYFIKTARIGIESYH